MAQVRVAIVAMLKAIGVSKFANECWFVNKGVDIVVPSERRCDDGPSELGCDDGSGIIGKEEPSELGCDNGSWLVGKEVPSELGCDEGPSELRCDDGRERKDLISGPSERRCDDEPICVDEESVAVKAIALERGVALRDSLPREPSAPLPGRSK